MPTPETPTLAGEKKKWTPAASGICKWEAAQKSVPAQKKTNDRTDFDRTEHNFYFYWSGLDLETTLRHHLDWPQIFGDHGLKVSKNILVYC